MFFFVPVHSALHSCARVPESLNFISYASLPRRQPSNISQFVPLSCSSPRPIEELFDFDAKLTAKNLHIVVKKISRMRRKRRGMWSVAKRNVETRDNSDLLVLGRWELDEMYLPVLGNFSLSALAASSALINSKPV